MRMPYWQFLLHIGLLSMTAHRGIGAYVLLASDAPWVLVACLVVQAVFALLASIAMWSPLRFQVGAISALATAVVAASIVSMFVLGERSVPLLMGQALFAVIAGTGVVAALRYAAMHPEGGAPR